MKKKAKLITILIGICLFLIFLDSSGKLNFISFPLRRILSPFQQIYNWAFDTVTSPISYFQFVQSGEKRLSQLEEKNLALLGQVQRMKDLESENLDLKQQLGADFTKNQILLPAKILGVGRSLEVEIDSSSQVKPGQAVVYLNNYIGQVQKVGWGIAYVKMAADPDSRVPAKSANATGVVTGEFSSGVTFDKVAKSETVVPGELVQTSGLEGTIPPDLILGKVEKIEPTGNELFQRASLNVLYDLKKIHTVYVVIN